MYISGTDSVKIVEAISGLDVKKGDVVLLMLGEKNMPDINQIIAQLNKIGVNFFGGVFPGIIYDDKNYQQGAIVTVLPAINHPFLIKELSQPEIKLPNFMDVASGYTAIVLVDGLTSNIAAFLSKLFSRFGNAVHYFGGGAGSLTLKQSPCLFTNEGFVQDAAIVTFVRKKSSLGVHHGWQKVKGPFVATSANKNIISELNWKNAFDVYREVVETDSGKKLSREDFYSLSMAYPFGMLKENGEDVVRDPIATNEKGELICVGEILQNAVMDILKGDKESLIKAASLAANDCCRTAEKNISNCLVIDCVSRFLFLGESFENELSAVKEKIADIDNRCVPEGALTLGEISSYGDAYLEFFNKTIVVGVLYE